MICFLGYDPYENPPNYGSAEEAVKENTNKLKNNQKLWDNKVKQLLKREEESEDNQEDNDSEKT